MEWMNLSTNLLVISLMITILYFKNYFKAVFLACKIPGPPGLPFFGNVFYIRDTKKMEHLATNVSELYGTVVKIWVSILPMFLILEPKDLQLLLGTNKYSTKNIFYTFLHNTLGEGLITDTGEKYKQHRKLIQPCFHVNILKVYFNTFLKKSKIIIKNLENETDINIVPLVNKFVLDVLHETVLGISAQNSIKSSPFRKGQVFMPYRLMRPWLLLNQLFKLTSNAKLEANHNKLLRNYVKHILDKKCSSIQQNETVNNLMAMLIEISKHNPDFKDEDIVNEVCTFMLAGQDSVGAALTFSLYFLAQNQDIQDKVMKELHSIFKEKNRTTVFEDINEMKYLEQCIKEAMRLCPSVPMITRKITEDVAFGKYVFPAGTNIIISPFATHRLPHIYPNPLKFDPDRFSSENKEKIHPYAYIPFSAGPRICIGYKFALVELKTVLSQILRNYHISLVPGHEKLDLVYRVTLKCKGGVWLRLKKRA